MDRWRGLLGGIRARGLTTIGLVISDPVAFADAFLGAVSAGFWVAPLDPSMPVTGEGGLAPPWYALAWTWWWRTGPPRRHREAWVELDRLDHLEDGHVTRPGATAPRRAGAGGVVLSSSGTTGTPKVVRLGQDKLLHTAASVASHLELGPRTAASTRSRCSTSTPRSWACCRAGRRFQPGPRRPLPPERLLGSHGRRSSPGSTRCPPSSRA